VYTYDIKSDFIIIISRTHSFVLFLFGFGFGLLPS